jgi:hypothetical protein
MNHIVKMVTSFLCMTMLLSACSSLWPFGNKAETSRVYKPANSTEYLCEKGKKFYVRTLDSGANVWLMLPDHEVLLAKVGNEKIYTNGISRLNLSANEVILDVSPGNQYVGCKVVPIQ